MQELYLGQTNVSLLERCLQFRGVLIERVGGGGGGGGGGGIPRV